MAYTEEPYIKLSEARFIDSVCSDHMTGNKKWFGTLDETYQSMVKLGSHARIKVMG